MDLDTILNAVALSPQTKATIAAGAVALYFIACFARGFFRADSVPGKVCAFIIDGLKPRATAPAASPTKPPLAPVALALLVGGALLVATPARAQEPSPVVPAAAMKLCAGDLCVNPGVGLAGTAYDFASKSIVKSVTISGLVEVTKGNTPIAGLIGLGFQTGDVQGMPLQIGVEYRPISAGVVYSEMLVGSRASRTITAGYVVRF